MIDPLRVRKRRWHRRAGFGVPDTRRTICAGRDDATAVRAEGGVHHAAVVAHRLSDRPARGDIPESRLPPVVLAYPILIRILVAARCNDMPPIRAERNPV